MRHRAYIFDFDGTLVKSNEIKREAFYSLSDEIIANRQAVDDVLASIPERSRYEIIEEIYKRISKLTGKKFNQLTVREAIDNYSKAVMDGVLSCSELEGAANLLVDLKSRSNFIFISSNTPEEPLGELIAARGWNELIQGYFGFPRVKGETIRVIMEKWQLLSSDIMVVGDGKSDEISAKENNCAFYRITNDKSLLELHALIEAPDMYV